MTISPMDGEFLDDLTNLAVYLKPAEGGNLRVVISRFLVDVINEAGLGISPLAGLLRESCHLPPGILSQGNTLMLLIAERLSMHLLKSKKLSEIPGLQYSKFSNTPLCKDQGEHFQVRHIPSFCVCVSTSCGKPAKRKINETEVISSFNPSDWNLFIDSPAVPRNAVGYPYDDNSAGPDGLALISSGNSQTPTLCMCMCIAAKNLQNKGAINWKDIQEEADKCLWNPHNAGVKLPKILLVISTHLTGEVNADFQGTDVLCVKEGSWCHNISNTGLVPCTRKDTPVITVPQNSELLIFSQSVYFPSSFLNPK